MGYREGRPPCVYDTHTLAISMSLTGPLNIQPYRHGDEQTANEEEEEHRERKKPTRHAHTHTHTCAWLTTVLGVILFFLFTGIASYLFFFLVFIRLFVCVRATKPLLTYKCK
jgi:hypothetical protein